MPRTLFLLAFLAAVAAAAPEPPQPVARSARTGIAVGDLVWTDRSVERADASSRRAWRRVAEGEALRTGDTLRTGEDALARVEFGWMVVTLGSSSQLTIPAATVLSTLLDQGRAEFSGPGRDIVKIQVGSGEVRGGGRLVLRRSPGQTSATALEGAFRVRAGGRIVTIKAGQGTVVRDGAPPDDPAVLPAAPVGLLPGADPAYVRAGQPIELRWSGADPSYHVDVLALLDDSVLLSRETAATVLRLEIPWVGTYRWRVSARDARGIESRPSVAGLICSVEK